MNMILKRLPAALCCVLCLVFLFAAAGPVQAEGRFTPVKLKDIGSVDANGLLKMINQEKGKVVVINIFASWCPPCKEEIPGLVKVRGDFSSKEVTMIGISVDKEPKALETFVNNEEINYPVYFAQGDFIERVGVTAVPQLLIYNKAGELVVNHKGLVDVDDLTQALKEIAAE